MRLVMVIENTSATSRLAVQHGLSLYIEGQRENYLFGLGADGKFLSNAAKMKLPVKSVGKAVISHNHHAHTGGVEALLDVNPDVTFFAKEAACRAQSAKKNSRRRRDGLFELYGKYPGNFVLFRNFQEVGKDFYLLSDEMCNEQRYSFDKNEYIEKDGEAAPFEPGSECFGVLFPFESKEEGCVIVAGCSHCGAGNIIRTVKNTWKDIPVAAYIGGLHLMGGNTKKLSVSGDFIAQTARDFKELGVGTVYACHCTGLKGYEELKSHMGERLQYLQTGEEIGF